MINLLSALDISLFYFFNHLPHTQALDFFAQLVSGFTSNGLLWLGIAVLLFIIEERKDHRLLLHLGLAAILGILTSEFILKPLVARPRPFLVLTDVILPAGSISDYSFPSTHALLAVALSYIFTTHRPRWRLAGWILVILITWSRMYLGYHYPSDIVTGMAIGWLIAKLVQISLARPPLASRMMSLRGARVKSRATKQSYSKN